MTDHSPSSMTAIASTTTPATEVVVHPLVLLSVVDHFRRCDEVRSTAGDARARRERERKTRGAMRAFVVARARAMRGGFVRRRARRARVDCREICLNRNRNRRRVVARAPTRALARYS